MSTNELPAPDLPPMVVPATEALWRTGLTLSVDALLNMVDANWPAARYNELSEHIDLSVLCGKPVSITLPEFHITATATS